MFFLNKITLNKLLDLKKTQTNGLIYSKYFTS